ncbi:hypothetical protein [Mycobacterium marinum]|uniref:hypothetical protein n=1 Tax=Mycobacterium marinum TaxID=1781 RepID=UPI00356A4B30
MALHPAAMVVRAGAIRDVLTLRRKVEKAIEDGLGACLSVFADVDRTDDEEAGMTLYHLCTVSEIPHNQVQLSTVARLVEQGFELELDTSADQARTHHNVTLGEPVAESELLKFIQCFGGPVPNPNPKKPR